MRTNLIANGMAPGEAAFKDIDYSHGRLCSLNENSLNETVGTYMQDTDWNCNGTLTTGVAQDINGNNGGWCASTGNRTTLTDYNEWSNIADPLTSFTDGVDIACITAEEWAEVQNEMLALGTGTQPDLVVEPCIGRNYFLLPGSGGSSGSCGSPLGSVKTAHVNAPNDSAFFLRPGVYNETGVTLLTKPGVYMANLGTAEIR